MLKMHKERIMRKEDIDLFVSLVEVTTTATAALHHHRRACYHFICCDCFWLKGCVIVAIWLRSSSSRPPQPHQHDSVLRAIKEHNLLAASNIYRNISITELAELLQIDPDAVRVPDSSAPPLFLRRYESAQFRCHRLGCRHQHVIVHNVRGNCDV